MSKPMIRVYELDKKGKKYLVSKEDHPLLDETGPKEPVYKSSDMSSESLLTHYLHGNPFLYNPETAEVEVSSLEDFIIYVKGEPYAFGDTIRNPKFTKRQRKKLIKKSFSDWKKEYTTKKNVVFKENDKVIEVIGDISYIEYTWKSKILIGTIFILLLFLVITNSFVWDVFKKTSLGYYMHSGLVSMYQDMNWLVLVGNIGIYVSLSLIFFSIIYSYIIKDFRKNYALAQSFLTNSETTISKDFKKKYRKARRYYLKRLNTEKHRFYPPIYIEDVQEGKMNITIFDEICKATVDRAYVVKKSKPYITTLKLLLEFASYGSSLVIVVMSLYSLIVKLFL